MTQLSFIEDNKIINVASVPKLSPFRYPGGKTWLIPRIRQWITSLVSHPSLLIEPFAGGGIVSLTTAFEQLADHVVMVELDEDVASVWHIILSNDANSLAQRIIEFNLTKETAFDVLNTEPNTVFDRAFQTILKNRVNRGGILAPGAGMVRYGENDKGILSRWYPVTLARRIKEIYERRERITFIQGNGPDVMQQHIDRSNAIFFIDPPYTAGGKNAGSRLYTHSQIDHQALFRIAQAVAGEVLMTYDNAPDVQALADDFGFDAYAIPMKNTHHAKMTELLIGRSLSWVRSIYQTGATNF